jgi:hypothetical protein
VKFSMEVAHKKRHVMYEILFIGQKLQTQPRCKTVGLNPTDISQTESMLK